MKEKILTFINSLKEKLQKNKKLTMLIEKIQLLINKLRKQNKQQSDKTSKFKRVWVRRLKRIFSLKAVSSFLAVIISVPALLLFGYAYWQDFQSKVVDEQSINRIINSNLNYATSYMIRELKQRRIKKKQLRQLIKDLNGMDDQGRIYKFVPCEDSYEPMFGEEPAPGNVVITKPIAYEYQISSYSCTLEPLTTKTIKLRRPPKSKKVKSKDNKAPHKPAHSEPIHKEEVKDPHADKPVPSEPVHKEDVRDSHAEKPVHSEPLHKEDVKDPHADKPVHSEPVHKEDVKDSYADKPVHSEPVHKEDVKDSHADKPVHSEPVHKEEVKDPH